MLNKKTFIVFIITLFLFFSLFAMTAYAAVPTVTTNAATGIEETNTTLHGNHTNATINVGFDYGLTTSYGNSYTILSTETLRPIAAGDQTQLLDLPTSGANWEKVDEETQDQGATIVYHGQAGTYADLYNIQNTSSTLYNITNVTVYIYADDKGASSASTFTIDIKTNGTKYSSSPINPADWWTRYSKYWTTNPNSGMNWTWDDIDSIQCGLTVTIQVNNWHLYCTQIYMVVSTNINSNFSYNLSSISPGTLYHYRAFATNASGTGYGSDMTFLTKPEVPTGFTASTVTGTTTQTSLTWTKGTGANNTYIERNTSSNWTRGTGTLVYNNTGTSYTDSVSSGTLYFYQAWSYTNWSGLHQYSDDNASDVVFTKPEAPTNLNITYISGTNINMSWTKGTGANNTVILRKIGSYPSSVTDPGATVVYNDTGTYYNDSISFVSENINYYRAWGYTNWTYNPTLHQYSENYTDNVFTGLVINAYDELDGSNITDWTIFISNQDGSQVYTNDNCNNPHVILNSSVPYGLQTMIQVEREDYEIRLYYTDIYSGGVVFFNVYLPLTETEEEEEYTIVSYTDSVSVTNPAVDAVINLTYTIENIISVDIYNQSLYGGWIFAPSDKYTIYPINITISNTILDVNTTMARVSYYFRDYIGEVTPIYYMRIVETYETSSGIFERPVENAIVAFKTYINATGKYENISILRTDANGYVNLYLIPSQLYKVMISKEGYDTKISDYMPQPPNIYGQTTEKTFRIEKTEAEDEPIPKIYMDALILTPYNTTTVWIYYLNLNNNNSYVNFTIYDYIGDTLLTYYNISTNPNNISIYFNFSSYNLSGDILRVTATAFRTDGSIYTLIKYFNVEQSRRMGAATSAPIAAILSIGICLFGLTIAHPKKVFGVVGIIVMIIAIAITAFAEQIWYIHLIQAIELILLIVIILTFKEEGVHAI